MSDWTHVNGAIRVDALPTIINDNFETEIREAIGEMVMDNTPTKVPTGSEGSLQYRFIPGEPNHMELFRVYIFGDLRDYNNAEEIINWFDNTCKDFLNIKPIYNIRQAVIQIEVEGEESIVHEFKTN